MAQYSEANTKTALAAAAVQLTLILKDTVKSEVTPALASPHHPIRKIAKLFNFNANTGVVTADDAYVTAAYDGLFPSKGNKFQTASGQVMVLTTATVEDAAQSNIVLTFDDVITSAENIVLGGEAKTIASISIVSNVVTIAVTVDYDNGDVINVTGDFKSNKLTSIALATESVTNNVV